VGVAVHAASPASTRGAFAAPAFSSGGASARRASGVPGSSTLTGFAATATAKVPRRLPEPPRERGARTCGRGAPSDDEERPRALPLLRCRTSRRACSPIDRSRSARCLGAGTATTALSLRHRTRRADLCNRRETRAHPRGDRHPARAAVAHGAAAPDWSLRAASMAGATPTRRTWSRSACMAARRPRWIRARAPSSRSRLAASVGAPLLTGATKAAAARPRERASSGRGRSAFWPRGDGAIAGAGCRTLTGATTRCSFAL